MSIYAEVPMASWGNLPTAIVKVPVSVPVPFVPDRTKILLWVLGISLVVLFIYWLLDKNESAKKAAIIKDLTAKRVEASAKIAALEKTSWEKYNDKK